MNKDNGGPAFPVEGMWGADGKFLRGIQTGSTPLTGWHEGMTLRDYFAAKAMHYYLSCEDMTWEEAAERCYGYADAMLRAREQ